MTQILNLDKIETREDKVIILKGKKHVMKTFTLKDYIHQVKTGKDISNLINDGAEESMDKILELSFATLIEAFPTLTKDDLENLNFDQLKALRQLTEDVNTAELEETDAGEAIGEVKAV